MSKLQPTQREPERQGGRGAGAEHLRASRKLKAGLPDDDLEWSEIGTASGHFDRNGRSRIRLPKKRLRGEHRAARCSEYETNPERAPSGERAVELVAARG